MDASVYPNPARFGDYGGPHPILTIAGSAPAQQRAADVIEAAGYRSVRLSFEEAFDRLAIQPGASGVWMELDENPDSGLDGLIDQVREGVHTEQWPAVIAAPFGMIDALEARIREPGMDLLIDASPADRAIAMAKLASWTRAKNEGVHEDASRDTSSARLRQLSDEVSRIAATLARLSTGPESESREKPVAPTGEAPSVSLETVRQVIRARRLRSRYFDQELFADPAWDMLLDLLQAEIAQHRVPVSSLCIAAAVPATTALRWIKTMTDVGLFRRRADPHDGRRVFVELSSDASDGMRRYFAEVGNVVMV